MALGPCGQVAQSCCRTSHLELGCERGGLLGLLEEGVVASLASACDVCPGYCEYYLGVVSPRPRLAHLCNGDTGAQAHHWGPGDVLHAHRWSAAMGDTCAVLWHLVLTSGFLSLTRPLSPRDPPSHLWQPHWFLGRSTSSFTLTLQELLIKLIVASAP